MSSAHPDVLPVKGAASVGRGAPPPVVRLGGLPVTVLAALRNDGSTALAERVLAGRRSLARAAEDLTRALYQEIGAVTDPALRPRLVGLRRSVHRLRRPATGEWSEEIRAALPDSLVAQVDQWLVRHRRLECDQARLPRLLARETWHGQAALRRLAADPGHRRALWRSSPSLSAEVDKWLADPDRHLRPQTAFRLAKYLARAATKTSPHSTFTVSGFGAWGGTGTAHPAAQYLRVPATPVPIGVSELHGALTEQLVDGLVRCPRLWEALVLRVNPSATEEAGRLSFLGRPPAEPILSIPVTPGLTACLRLVDTDPPLPVGAVRDRLAQVTGGDPTASDRLLRYLVRTGLLEAWPATGDGPIPLGGAARWLRTAAVARPAASDGERPAGQRPEHPAGDPADLAGAFDRLADGLRKLVPVANVAEYRHRQESLRTTVELVLDRLGAGRPHQARQPVAADTAVSQGVLAECDPAGWNPVLADLDTFRQWVAGFNPALPLRLALAHWWHDRLGLAGEVSFLHFHRAVQAGLRACDPEAVELRRLLAGRPIDLAASAFPRVRELWRLREQALGVFRDAGQAGQERRVTAAGLAAAAAGWPEWVPPVGSMGCYLQPLLQEPGAAVVLEVVDTGYGRGRNRMAHLLRRAGVEPPATGWRSCPPDGPVLAELAGAFGSTLNDRLPSVPYQLDYPFTAATAGDRPAGQRLPLADLVVAAGPDRGLLRLRSRRLAAEVTALDLGLLMRPLLPPAARLLVQAFGELPMVRPSQLLPALAPPATEAVRRLPRVWAGRVLLRRGGWLVAHSAVPRRRAGEPDADYLLRLLDWRSRAGVPDRCFYRSLRLTGTGSQDDRLRFDKSRKPTYLDFGSWLLVRAFENALTTMRNGLVLFEEALPDPVAADAPRGAPRVVELLVEVSTPDACGESGAVDGRW